MRGLILYFLQFIKSPEKYITIVNVKSFSSCILQRVLGLCNLRPHSHGRGLPISSSTLGTTGLYSTIHTHAVHSSGLLRETNSFTRSACSDVRPELIIIELICKRNSKHFHRLNAGVSPTHQRTRATHADIIVNSTSSFLKC